MQFSTRPSRYILPFLFVIAITLLALHDVSAQFEKRLAKSSRRPAVDGWTQVHLEGSPADIGFQHGWLLAAEIADLKAVLQLELLHDTKRDWNFFRREAETMLWPHIAEEYRIELQGIADGAHAKGQSLDLWDVVAINAFCEWEYYTGMRARLAGDSSVSKREVSEHCSAFVATGSYTRDGHVIIAHNNWSTYLEGSRWTIAFDIVPSSGHRFVMDGIAGLISSADDFGINDAGIMVTETTISGFRGYDTTGVPEFVRARHALQYAASIDDFFSMMTVGNNGGYANTWLVADRKSNEIASLELGLKIVTLQRTKDGCFYGANFPENPELTRQETSCDPSDSGRSCYARKRRWESLMSTNRGKIDVEAAKLFMADHFDTFQKKMQPNERTLCGHIDLSPRGSAGWQDPYGPAGTVQSKIADARMAGELTYLAAAGHSCGMNFNADSFIHDHPEFAWQRPLLHDVPAHPWTLLSVR